MAHEDLYTAITDAFSALESQMKTFVGKQRVLTIPHRRIDTGEVEPTTGESGAEWESYGIDFADRMETHGAGESATG